MSYKYGDITFGKSEINKYFTPEVLDYWLSIGDGIKNKYIQGEVQRTIANDDDFQELFQDKMQALQPKSKFTESSLPSFPSSTGATSSMGGSTKTGGKVNANMFSPLERNQYYKKFLKEGTPAYQEMESKNAFYQSVYNKNQDLLRAKPENVKEQILPIAALGVPDLEPLEEMHIYVVVPKEGGKFPPDLLKARLNQTANYQDMKKYLDQNYESGLFKFRHQKGGKFTGYITVGSKNFWTTWNRADPETRKVMFSALQYQLPRHDVLNVAGTLGEVDAAKMAKDCKEWITTPGRQSIGDTAAKVYFGYQGEYYNPKGYKKENYPAMIAGSVNANRQGNITREEYEQQHNAFREFLEEAKKGRNLPMKPNHTVGVGSTRPPVNDAFTELQEKTFNKGKYSVGNRFAGYDIPDVNCAPTGPTKGAVSVRKNNKLSITSKGQAGVRAGCRDAPLSQFPVNPKPADLEKYFTEEAIKQNPYWKSLRLGLQNPEQAAAVYKEMGTHDVDPMMQAVWAATDRKAARAAAAKVPGLGFRVSKSLAAQLDDSNVKSYKAKREDDVRKARNTYGIDV